VLGPLYAAKHGDLPCKSISLLESASSRRSWALFVNPHQKLNHTTRRTEAQTHDTPRHLLPRDPAASSSTSVRGYMLCGLRRRRGPWEAAGLAVVAGWWATCEAGRDNCIGWTKLAAGARCSSSGSSGLCSVCNLSKNYSPNVTVQVLRFICFSPSKLFVIWTLF